MRKNATRRAFSNKYFLLSIVLAGVAITGFTLSALQKPTEIIEPVSTYVSTEEKGEQLKETIENGVYTNYTYGFQFNFDENIFDLDSPWQNHLNSKFATARNDDNLRLRMSFEEKWNKRADTNYTKLYDISEGDLNGEAYLLTVNNEGGDGDSSATYTAVYQLANAYLILSMGHKDGIDDLAVYKNHFDEIARSLRLLTTQ